MKVIENKFSSLKEAIMSKKTPRRIQPKDTLRACYFRGFFRFFFVVNGIPKMYSLYFYKKHKHLEKFSNHLVEYGIQLKDVEKVLIHACKEANIKLPAYLR